MQKVQSRLQENRPHQLKTSTPQFAKLKNRVTHQYSNDVQTPRQIVQTPSKSNEMNTSSNTLNTPTLQHSHKRTDSKEIPKRQRLKLKDYLRLNEISKQKRFQSADAGTKLRSNKTLQQSRIFDRRITFCQMGQPQVPQTPIKSSKKPPKTYTRQIQLEKTQLLQTIQKAKQKFNKISNLIQQTNQKLTTYNDLVFMFNIEEILNNYILKGFEEIRSAYSQHFVGESHTGIEKSVIQQKIDNFSPKKSRQVSKSPALRAQQKALQEIYVMSYQMIPKLLPITSRSYINQFDQDEAPSKLNRSTLQLSSK